MKSIITLFTTLFLSCVLFAQVPIYEWKDATPRMMNMLISDLAYTKGGHFIITTEQGYIAESIDTGKNWNLVYDVFIPQTNIFTKQDEIIVNFQKMSFSKDSLSGVCPVTIENKLTEDKENILLWTSDGGHSWQPVKCFNAQDNILCEAWNADGIYALVHRYNSLYVDLYKSINAGKDWNLVVEHFDYIGNNIPSYYMAFVNDNTGYIFTNGKYWETTNKGVTWNNVINENMLPNSIMQFRNGKILLHVNVFVNIQNNNFLCVNIENSTPTWLHDRGNGEVYAQIKGVKKMSMDSGRTWTTTTENHSYYEIKENLWLNFNRATCQYSENQGESWISNSFNGQVGLSRIFSGNNGRIYMIGHGSSGRIFVSENQGKDWTYKDLAFGTCHAVQCIENRVYLVGDKNLYISDDFGNAWIEKKLPSTDISYIKFFTPQLGFLGDGVFFYKTEDGGTSWSEIYLNQIFYGMIIRCDFKDEQIGLVQVENDMSKCIINGDSYTLETIVENKNGSIYYIDNKWIIVNAKKGEIYTCDENFVFSTVYKDDNYSGNTNFSNLLSLGNNTLLIPMATSNTAYRNEYAVISYDNGLTWEKIEFQTPAISKFCILGNSIYGYETDSYYSYNIIFYKGIHKIEKLNSSFEKQENGTIQCSISNTENQTYTAKVLVEQVNGASIVVSENIEIKSGEPFVITLPNSIEANYVIKVIPEDEEVYETVQSQEFIVNNGGSAIDAISSGDIQIRVVNGKIECSCEEYAIYNVAGQKVQDNASLPSGTYFVHCGTQVKKVVVQ